jgi:Domain of unknown function (DUF5122) beta-propeller
MVVDANGRILVGGNFGIARYLADGTPDATFGVNGVLASEAYGGGELPILW